MASAVGDKKLVKSRSGLRIVSIEDSGSSPFLLPEPAWVPDNEYANCMQCQARFDFMNRRHHCRRCGRLYCSKCCENKVLLPRMCFVDPVRVCGSCTKVTKSENEFFERHVKTLMNGGEFKVMELSDKVETLESTSYMCKMSSDHRYIQFEADNMTRESIMLTKIETIQILTPSLDSQGNSVGTGLSIAYINENGQDQVVKMLVDQGPNKKQGMMWVAAMQKASKLLYEVQNQ